MTPPDRNPTDELRGLVDALCEETITSEGMARLEELLLADPAAEEFYTRSMLIQSKLIHEFGGALPVGPEEGRGQPGDLGLAEIAAIKMPDGSPEGHRSRWRLGGRGKAGLVAASIILLASFALSRTQVMTSGRARIVPPEPRADFATRLATVIDLDGTAWDAAQAPGLSKGDILGPRRLQLRSGRLTLAFLSGVMLTAEGPADLELVSLSRVVCHRGRLRVRVSHGAEGFTVVTPGSTVVDLGTEFGVNVGDDGKASVMVFEGQAEIMGRGFVGVPNRIQRVVQSRSFESDPRTGDIRETIPDSRGFVASAELIPPPLELAPDYVDTVLESRPWGYWRFESLVDGEVKNEVPGGLPLLATGPIRLGGAAGNRCAVFSADEVPKYFAVDEHVDSSGAEGYAFEIWAMTEEYKHATLVALSTKTPGEPLPYGHLSVLEMTVPGQWPFLDSALFRFLHRRPPGNSGGIQLYNGTPYIPYRWHHLVAQSHGDRMEFFMDGSLVRTQALDHRGAIALDRIVLGRQTELDEPSTDGRHFPGRMDEVAIYFHPLSAETVRQHFERAKQPIPPR